MADSPRLEELRRRVERDPASIAFAALAEEYRRAGRFQEAIDVCRAGLRRHPVYLSARVTLGRVLLELGEFGEARRELQHVLQVAPDNLAALQALDEIGRRSAEGAQPSTAAPPAPLPNPARPADTSETSPSSSPPEGRRQADSAVIAGLEGLLEGIRRARAALDTSPQAVSSRP